MTAASSDFTGRVRSEFADDPEFSVLLEQFAEAIAERRKGLLDAHRNGAYDVLRSRAHQLKGAGGGFGYPRLSEVAADLERACLTREPVRIAAALERLVSDLNRIAPPPQAPVTPL